MSQKPHMATHRHVREPGYATGFADVHKRDAQFPPCNVAGEWVGVESATGMTKRGEHGEVGRFLFRLPVDISPPLGRRAGRWPHARPQRRKVLSGSHFQHFSLAPPRAVKAGSTKRRRSKRCFTSPVQNTAPLRGCRNLSGVAVVLRGGACGAVQIPLSAWSVQFRRVLPDSLNSRLDS